VPVIVDRLPGELGACVAYGAYAGSEGSTEDALSWNLGRAAASDALAGVERPADCSAYLSDRYQG